MYNNVTFYYVLRKRFQKDNVENSFRNEDRITIIPMNYLLASNIMRYNLMMFCHQNINDKRFKQFDSISV